MRKGITYKDSGVDIDQGDDFVRRILPLTKNTQTLYSMDTIGSFAGMIDLSGARWKNPVLVACTDGVGTKLKIAFEMNRHDGIGIDLVAMSINDLLVTGAEPVAFLDYLATSRLDGKRHAEVVKGICKGCIQSGCALIGGETAEMPGFYSGEEYDLAGFAIGIVEKDNILTPETVMPGDVFIGLPSSGIHSNGFSLVRKVFHDRTRFPLHQNLPGFSRSLGEELLTPTRIYSAEFEILRRQRGLKSAAHITGGGIPGNLVRALPKELGASVDPLGWPIPKIFLEIQKHGRVTRKEMFRTFNMGLGMILVVDAAESEPVQHALDYHGIQNYRMGRVVSQPGFFWKKERPAVTRKRVPKKRFPIPGHSRLRLAVLGSGRGSNMLSICDAIDRGDLDAEVVCVISNNSRAPLLDHARSRAIPAFHVSGKNRPGKEAETMLAILEDYKADTLVLAGYMKRVPDRIVEKFSGRSFNIHPALLPAFGGKGMYGSHVHGAVIRSGARYSGVTVHRVAREYDTGKILAQRIVPVLPSDTAETLAERVLAEEHDLYWRVLKQYAMCDDDECNKIPDPV